MRTLAVLGTAALFAATPASILLIGSATFSEEVPVRVPSTALLLDSNGRTVGTGRALVQTGSHPGAGVDRTGAARPSARPTPDDHGGASGDDGSSGSGSSGSGSSGHGGDDGGHHQRRGGDARGDDNGGDGGGHGGSGSGGSGSDDKSGSGSGGSGSGSGSSGGDDH